MAKGISNNKQAAIAATRALFGVTGQATKVVGGQQALSAMRKGLLEILPEDGMGATFRALVGTSGGDVIAALLMKGFQTWGQPDSAMAAGAADAAVDAAFHGLVQELDLGSVITSMAKAIRGVDEKNNSSKKEVVNPPKPKDELTCAHCGETKRKKNQIKVFKIPENQKGLVPEADKQEGNGLCAECIQTLNALLTEAFDAKSIDAAKAKADKDLVDGIEKGRTKEDRIANDIAHYEQKIKRLTKMASDKKIQINKIMNSGKSDKDLPEVNGDKAYPAEDDKIWIELFSPDFRTVGYTLVSAYQSIMLDLLEANNQLAIRKSGGKKEEERKEEATSAKDKQDKPAPKQQQNKAEKNNKTKKNMNRKKNKKNKKK